MSVKERVYAALKEYGEPMRGREIAQLIGEEQTNISQPLARLMRQGRVRRLGRGVYVATDEATLGHVAEIEVRPSRSETVTPETPNAGVRGADRTVSFLLQVIARADDPKPYAGVVREIGDLLATS